jgi:hypothetical protein
MPTCDECKGFFPLDEDPLKGDCVTREDDGKVQFWMSRPTTAFQEAEGCPRFIAKTDTSKEVKDLAGQDQPVVDNKVISW